MRPLLLRFCLGYDGHALSGNGVALASGAFFQGCMEWINTRIMRNLV